MAVTLESIIERALRMSNRGWAGSITSLTTTTLVDSAAVATSLGTDAWKGAYLFRPDAASSVDYNRRISAFTVASGTFTHDGANYSDTTATSENYMVCGMYPAMDWVGVGFSWQRGVNLTLEKLPSQVVRDGHTLGSGGTGGKSLFGLSGLSGVNRRSQLRRVWRRRAHGPVDLTVTAGEALNSSDTTFTVSDGTAFRVNDVVRQDSEDMLIRGISTNDLTVTRAYFGTTAASHSSGGALKRVEYLDVDARTQLMDWRWQGGVDSSGVNAFGLWMLPAVGSDEQVVVEYEANWTALTTPASTTEAPIEVVATGAVLEVLKAAGPTYLTEAAMWQRRFQETLLSWMPGVVVQEP